MLKHTFSCLALVVCAAFAQPAWAVPMYAIDINSNGSPTAPGFVGLDTASGSGAGSVVIDGITFSTGSTDGSRDRGAPNDLTSDFIFDDGNNEALILFFGGAGDLEAGKWRVSVWSWDEDFPGVGDQIVGYRTNTSETIVDTNAMIHPTDPISTFTFMSDGVSAYDVFLRENGTNNTRLNAVLLTKVVPEPGTSLLVALGGLGMLGLRRRRRRAA